MIHCSIPNVGFYEIINLKGLYATMLTNHSFSERLIQKYRLTTCYALDEKENLQTLLAFTDLHLG